jgi:hypothetical protein
MRSDLNRDQRRRAVACAIAVSVGLASCARAPAAAPPAETAAAAAAASTSVSVSAGPDGNAAPHGDHNPHHGGVVMMKGDLHYELVLDPAGRAHRVYFTDAVREELPASMASAVALTIRRPSQPDEPIVMQIDDTGESWIGRGQPVASPKTTTARLAFSIQGEPYWIDLPFSSAGGDSRQP